jgi:hypothetical protein
MDLATTPAVERIARVIAAHELSRNGDGDEAHAAAHVDAHWSAHRDEAIAILKTLREPDAAMERAGDATVWQRMIDAAIGDTGA